MSQTYAELNGTDTLKASRSTINSNFDAIKTDFSGTSAPFTASSSTLGATYYNTSDKKNYRVVQSGSNYVWTDINTLVPTQALDDISNSAANTEFVFKSVNKSNCILEIPQDINLTLSSGTLTLKSGSNFYVPTGSSSIEEYQLTNDIQATNTSNGQLLVFLYRSSLPWGGTPGVLFRPLNKVVSGSTDTLAGATYHTWFDTTNNLIKVYSDNGSTISGYACFPLCIVTVSNGAISSIDQVFNGFGYIGSTNYVLPGVKGLSPNGRNADGTLKNTTITSSALLITTETSNGTRNITFNAAVVNNYISVYYDEEKNVLWNSSNPQINCVYAGTITRSNGVITKLNVKNVFHPVDYYDLQQVKESTETLDSQNVKLTGNQSIVGNKTFTGSTTFSGSVSLGSSATATTKGATDNSTAVSTTAFVKLLVPVSIGSGTKPVYTNSSGVITASNSDVGSATQPIYMDKGTLTAGTELNTAAYVADNTLVHRTGNETIAGDKTFRNTLYATSESSSDTREGFYYLKNLRYSLGTAPSVEINSNVVWHDSTGSWVALTNHKVQTSGAVQLRLQCRKPDKSTSTYIGVGYNSSGNPFTYAPAPLEDTTDSNQIDTVGARNTKLASYPLDNTVVHIGSAETITGEKTFTGTTRAEKASAGYYQTYIKNTAVTIGTAPSTNTGYQIIMNDSSGTQNGRIGALTLVYKSNGDCDTYLTAYKPVGTGQTNSTMGIRYPASGNPYGYAPTPDSATDNSTKIATTEWIHTFLTTNDADAFSTWTKAAKGGFKLANGLIVNWGRSTGSTKTVTYAIPFSSDTSFAITTAFVADREAGTHWGRINSVTSTNFKVVRDTNDTVHWIAIGY